MTILSPDVEAAIDAIKVISPEYNLSEHMLEQCIRDAIYSYSPAARTLCVGQSNDFCRGVLLTLHLNHIGKLPTPKEANKL
ncbi:hypothetical protein SIPHO067v1_p0046 [Vibrio phage 51E28.1]|nr:hypothetical protein SIPHO068v1_p0054 [Vibrio phage 51E28.4]QZI92641.1 hypothetical protein SIPHO059v1_p0046 [Vibrio phage 264E42.1]QZI92886.1 hypothetical protein SIPHO067v1_p0046 [Vibrio phage 51E28.1]